MVEQLLTAGDVQHISEVLGEADEKTNALQSIIDTFIAENSEAIRCKKELKVTDDCGLNSRIDEIGTDAWEALSLICLRLKRVYKRDAYVPYIWREGVPAPMINYGPNQKPTLPIINALSPLLCAEDTLSDSLRTLLTITGDKNRELRIMRESFIAGFRDINAKPDAKDGYTIGFVPREYTDIQTSFIIRSTAITLSYPNPIVPCLRRILEDIETMVSTI